MSHALILSLTCNAPLVSKNGYVRLWDIYPEASSASGAPSLSMGRPSAGSGSDFAQPDLENRNRLLPGELLSDQGTRQATESRCQVDQIGILKHDGAEIVSIAFSPNGRLLAVVTEKQLIHLWDLSDLNADPILLQGHTQQILSIAFDPRGEWLLSASTDQTVRMWALALKSTGDYDLSDTKTRSGMCLISQEYAFTNHNFKVLAVSPDGQWLASASHEGEIHLWLKQSGTDQSLCDSTPQHTLTEHEGPINSLVFSPDGQTLASAGYDGMIGLWDMNNLNTEPTLLGYGESEILSLLFTPDGQQLISAHQDGTIRLWRTLNKLVDLACNQVRRNLTLEEWRYYLGNELPYEATCPNLPTPPTNQ